MITSRRPLKAPILLAVAMFGVLLVLTVGWVILSVVGAVADDRLAAFYWTVLPIGTAFIFFLIVGVAIYLALSIKAINLSQRQSNFIDSVTHELKSPIASLKLYLQTLHRHHLSADEQAGFYESMLEDVERLDRLINQMLDAGRVDSGPVDGEQEDVALDALLQECAQAVTMRYRVPDDVVRLDLNPCIVQARRMDLDLVFRNLLDNAVKYAGAEPLVEVSLTAAGERATVRIRDNGRGIPYAMRRRIFGRFVRLGSELEREKAGTGLGLYIVQTVARRLHAKLRVRDPASGPGALFEVQLPMTRATEE